MHLVELDLNPSHPQAVYQSQRELRRCLYKLQVWPGSPWLLEPGKEALGVALMAPHFPLGSLQGPTARTL